MEKAQRILMVIILVCLCALAWASIFIWHNIGTTIVFTACIIIWLLVLNLDSHEKE